MAPGESALSASRAPEANACVSLAWTIRDSMNVEEAALKMLVYIYSVFSLTVCMSVCRRKAAVHRVRRPVLPARPPMPRPAATRALAPFPWRRVARAHEDRVHAESLLHHRLLWSRARAPRARLDIVWPSAPQPLRKAWPSARKMASKLSQTLQQHDDEEDHGPEPPEPEPAPGWSYHEVVAPQRLDIVQRSPRGLVVLLRWRLHVGLHARGRLHAHRRAAHRRGGKVRLHQRRPCHVHRHYARPERKHRCGVAVWLSERGVHDRSTNMLG